MVVLKIPAERKGEGWKWLAKGLWKSVELWNFLTQRRNGLGENSEGRAIEKVDRRITVVNEENS